MAKVIFAIPPSKRNQGFATSNQNRQGQYLKQPFFAYPVIPAIFATMISKTPGHSMLWLDAVAERLDQLEFGQLIVNMQPDYIVFEANTMLINDHYQYINDLKEHLPDIKIILCGEHVTALPEEAKEKCKADHILSGGKWYYEAFKIITDKDWFEPLPHIDRNLTRWWLYAYDNGNFKYAPATYMMASQDCWHRPGCTFCSWANYHKEYEVRSVEDYLEEVEELINMGFKEIFDDSGTFPVGDWLTTFCKEMVDRGYNKYISWGCNMRFGALRPEDFKMMSDAGCRFILWGFESVNQTTLDRINKGYKIESINRDLILSHKCGIWNHLTVMFGYPWEREEDERRTYDMARWLLKNGWVDSAQATIVMPYPGTELFKWADRIGILKHKDWSNWDMTDSVFKETYPKDLKSFQKGIYNTSFHPRFLWNKIKQVRSMHDLRFYFRLGKKVIDRFGNMIEHSKAVAE